MLLNEVNATFKRDSYGYFQFAKDRCIVSTILLALPPPFRSSSGEMLFLSTFAIYSQLYNAEML